MRQVRLRKQALNIDLKLLVLVLVIVIIGLAAVADASAPYAIRKFDDEFFFLKHQGQWAVVGVFGMFVASQLKYTIWEKWAKHIFAANLILLLLVLIPGVGSTISGATRWIVVGPVSIQPSELLKLTMAMYLAKVASSDKGPLSYFLPLGLGAFLVMLQPDLGTTISIGIIGMTQIFLAGVPLMFIGGSASLGLIGAIVLILSSDYRRARLMTFLSADSDPLGKSYHVRQILIALGTGGMFGVGLGQSRQKYSFLPEPETDSIFAVIAEEVGFVGSVLFLLLLFAFVYRSIMIIKNAPDRFSFILGAGIIAWIAGQMLINISAIVVLVPLTGLPLPLISYGGSSLTTVLFGIGIILNISKHAKQSKPSRR